MMITKGTAGKARGSAEAVAHSAARAHRSARVPPGTCPSGEAGARLLLAGAQLCPSPGSQRRLGTSAFGGKTVNA